MQLGEIEKSTYEKKADAPGKSVVVEISENDGEAIREVEYYQLPGIGASPTPGDQAITITVEGGYRVAIASQNYSIDLELDKGETKIYSTDPTGNVKLAEIYLDNTGKIKVSNSLEDFKTLINDLIDEISDLKTFGSPTNHTVDPSSQALLTALKTRFNLLFKD